MEPSENVISDEFWSAVQADDERVRRSRSDLALFAPARWTTSVALGEWAFEAGPRELVHGLPDDQEPFISVVTTPGRGLDTVRARWINHHGSPAHNKAEHLERVRAFETHETRRGRVLVEDSWVEFDVWGDDTRWWAAVETPRYGIALEAANLDPAALALVRVDDVEPYLAGRTAWIRRQRGEV